VRISEREKHPTTPHQPTAASRWKTGPRPGARSLVAWVAVRHAHWLSRLSVKGGSARAPPRAGGGGRSRKSGDRVVAAAAAAAAAATFNRQQRCGREAAKSKRPSRSVVLPSFRPRPCQQKHGTRSAQPRGFGPPSSSRSKPGGAWMLMDPRS
jgi:hypothetical protein